MNRIASLILCVASVMSGALFSGCSDQDEIIDVVDEPEGSLLPDMIWTEGVEWYEAHGYEDLKLLLKYGNSEGKIYESIFDNPIVRFLIIKYQFKSEIINGKKWLRAYMFSTDGTKSAPTERLIRLEGSRVYAFFEATNQEYLIRDFRQYVSNGNTDVLKLYYYGNQYESYIYNVSLGNKHRILIGEDNKYSVDVFFPDSTSWKFIKYIGPLNIGLGQFFQNLWDGIGDGYPKVDSRILQIRNNADGYGLLYQDADYDKIWERRGAGGGAMVNHLDPYEDIDQDEDR